jgi:predicted XRE-type DNA-binding protein
MSDLDLSCGGTGYLHCWCGGDFCCCGLMGGAPCDGCDDCGPDDDERPPQSSLDGIREALLVQILRQMAEQKVSRVELARRLGVSRSRITHLLKGESIGIEMLARVADALGCVWAFRLRRVGADTDPAMRISE